MSYTRRVAGNHFYSYAHVDGFLRVEDVGDFTEQDSLELVIKQAAESLGRGLSQEEVLELLWVLAQFKEDVKYGLYKD